MNCFTRGVGQRQQLLNQLPHWSTAAPLKRLLGRREPRSGNIIRLAPPPPSGGPAFEPSSLKSRGSLSFYICIYIYIYMYIVGTFNPLCCLPGQCALLWTSPQNKVALHTHTAFRIRQLRRHVKICGHKSGPLVLFIFFFLLFRYSRTD